MALYKRFTSNISNDLSSMMKLAMMTQAYTVQTETKRDLGNIDCNPMDAWQKKKLNLLLRDGSSV